MNKAGAQALNLAYIADGSYCVYDGTKNTVSAMAPDTYTANINGKLYFTAAGGGNMAIAKAGDGDTITLCEETTANKTLAANTLVIAIGEGGSYSGSVSTTSLGYEVVTAVSGNITTYSVQVTAGSALAKWDDKFYATAAEAFTAAYNAGSDKAVILLKDSPFAVSNIKAERLMP